MMSNEQRVASGADSARVADSGVLGGSFYKCGEGERRRGSSPDDRACPRGRHATCSPSGRAGEIVPSNEEVQEMADKQKQPNQNPQKGGNDAQKPGDPGPKERRDPGRREQPMDEEERGQR